jgi:hypothetical protein
MSFKVFLSHSASPEDQPVVWRLQTLATSYGIELYVPARGTHFDKQKSRNQPFNWVTVQREIDRSDCVIALITATMTSHTERELGYALGKKRLVVPILGPNVEPTDFQTQFPIYFQYHPYEDPGKVATDVLNYLNKQKIDKEAKQALAALVAIGVGMLLLSAAAKE